MQLLVNLRHWSDVEDSGEVKFCHPVLDFFLFPVSSCLPRFAHLSSPSLSLCSGIDVVAAAYQGKKLRYTQLAVEAEKPGSVQRWKDL